MEKVQLSQQRLGLYRHVVRHDLYKEVQQLARALRGLKVVHVNATPDGGGVAELLKSLVPLMRDAGIDAQWYVMEPDEAFFNVTKHLHNLLQGSPGELSPEERRIYVEHNERTYARMKDLRPDVWVIHDPQPMAAGAYLDHHAPKVWRSHIDTSQPNPDAARFIKPYLERYQALVYSHDSYRLPGTGDDRVHVIEPAIDPLTVKNRGMPRARAREILARIGIDPDRPLVAQVARLDPWKDPLGVIDAYRLARREVPGLQLALLGVMAAQDDPEAAEVYRVVQAYAGDDPDIHIFVDGAVIGPEEVAAVQTGSDVVIQKSIREGFGLSATEAMWKGTPTIVGDVGGLRVQVLHGRTGYCVQGAAECARYLVALLKDPDTAQLLGRAGQERVRARYLLPRLLRDELRLYGTVVEPAPVPAEEARTLTAANVAPGPAAVPTQAA